MDLRGQHSTGQRRGDKTWFCSVGNSRNEEGNERQVVVGSTRALVVTKTALFTAETQPTVYGCKQDWRLICE